MSAETETPQLDEIATAPEKPTEQDADTPERPRPSFVPRRGLLLAATVLVLVALGVTTVVQWRDADRLRASRRTEELIRTRSAQFGQVLLAYRHDDLPGAKSKILALTSSDFGKSYQTAFSGLAEVIGKYKADATASVTDVYVNEIDGQRAKALVVVDSEVRSTVGVRRVVGTKLLLELILEHGVWKVNAMANLPADDETLTKPDGTTERPTASPSAGVTP